MKNNLDRMIQEQIVRRGVDDERVIAALRQYPREWFVPDDLKDSSYADAPLPIGRGQTISQPYIVALMTQLARVKPSDRVLEIGTGSAYQTAILSALADTVYSAEFDRDLAAEARRTIERIGLENVVFREGDALAVFRDEAPFNVILSAAAPEKIPDVLIGMLDDEGRLVMPAGPPEEQTLWLIERSGGELRRTNAGAVRFVPLRRQGP